MRVQSAYFAATRPGEQQAFEGLPCLAQVGASLNGRDLIAAVVRSAGLGGEDSSPSAARLCVSLARHQAEVFPATNTYWKWLSWATASPFIKNLD